MTTYPWLKLWIGTADDPKLRAAARIAGCHKAIAVNAWIAALEYAGEHRDRGSVKGLMPEVLAEICDTTREIAVRLFQAFRELGILLGERIAKWTKRQTEKLPRPRTANAERIDKCRRKKAEKAAQGALDLVTPPFQKGISSAVEEEKDQLINQLESPSCVPPHGGETTPPAAIIQISAYRQKEAAHDGKSSRGSRISADWEASPEDHDFAGRRGLDPVDTAADFRDYWLAESGARAVKRDWSAAFKHWCRNAERGASGGGFGRNRNQPPSLIEAARQAMFIKTR